MTILGLMREGLATETRALSCTLPPSGLVSWWPGDGDTNDIADGNDGTAQNGATFATGQVGQAFSFDGVNDLVSAAAAPNLDVQNAITLDGWVNLGSFVAGGGGFVMVAGRPSGYQINVKPDGVVRFAFPSGGGGAVNKFVDSSTSISLNTWTHLAATYDSSVGQIKIYVNGALSNSASTSGVIDSMVKPFQIGGFSDPGATLGFLNGLVDEVELYDRALSAAEIQAIFDADSAGKCKAVGAVGGIVELHAGADSPAVDSSSSSAHHYATPIAVAVTAGVLALAAGGWYAGRRWLR